DSNGVPGLLVPIKRLVDRNGNYIQFNYTPKPGYPGTLLLSSITDKNGSNLLSVTRDAITYAVTQVYDRYSRSVYYRSSSYATSNVPVGYNQSYLEVDHVSQIVTTGTANPPDRYAYGYQNINNGENNEAVPFLHSITAPSPTGVGNATAYINY